MSNPFARLSYRRKSILGRCPDRKVQSDALPLYHNATADNVLYQNTRQTNQSKLQITAAVESPADTD